MTENILCRKVDLTNERDVEAAFVEPLLRHLGYPEASVKRNRSLDKLSIPKGSRTEYYRPDYVLHDSEGKPVIVLDAKAPEKQPEDYKYQVSGYALLINQRHADENPVKYVAVTNGLWFIVWRWDSDKIRFSLQFEEFVDENPKLLGLQANLGYKSMEIERITAPVFRFDRPNIHDLPQIFTECHNLIWKKEKLGLLMHSTSSQNSFS